MLKNVVLKNNTHDLTLRFLYFVILNKRIPYLRLPNAITQTTRGTGIG